MKKTENLHGDFQEIQSKFFEVEHNLFGVLIDAGEVQDESESFPVDFFLLRNQKTLGKEVFEELQVRDFLDQIFDQRRSASEEGVLLRFSVDALFEGVNDFKEEEGFVGFSFEYRFQAERFQKDEKKPVSLSQNLGLFMENFKNLWKVAEGEKKGFLPA